MLTTIPRFGAVAEQRITRSSLSTHIKKANEIRAIVGRLEYAMQHGHHETANAMALMAQERIGELVQATAK